MGKSTLAVNLAGALALNAETILVDEDPLQSCHQWGKQNGHLPMPVLLPQEAERSDLARARYLLVDINARPQLSDLRELIRSSAWTLIPCGTSGLEIEGTLRLIQALKGAGTPLEKVKVSLPKHRRVALWGSKHETHCGRLAFRLPAPSFAPTLPTKRQPRWGS